ncbi:Adenosine 5'-monophosphoramidase, partial [Linderina pennispora]
MSSVPKSDCTLCSSIKGEVQAYKLIETGYTTSFLDIHPPTDGHVQIITKYHTTRMHELPDKYLADVLLVVKKIAKAM